MPLYRLGESGFGTLVGHVAYDWRMIPRDRRLTAFSWQSSAWHRSSRASSRAIYDLSVSVLVAVSCWHKLPVPPVKTSLFDSGLLARRV